MTDHKFADDDVIKALECCTLGDCFPCAYRNIGVGCRDKMNADALALILRQKAEIDDLKVELDAMRGAANSYKMHYETARAEAIKEFAKFLIDHSTDNTIFIADLPDLVIEMTEDHNESQNT